MSLTLDLFESSIEHERVYPHPPEQVWRALTESELLAAWLMDNDLEDVAVGETFEFRDDPIPLLWDGVTHCEILAVEPPEKLVIAWEGSRTSPRTELTWLLEPVEEGTRMTFTHEGFEGLSGLVMRMGLRGGWETMYEQSLPAVLDRLEAGESVSAIAERYCG